MISRCPRGSALALASMLALSACVSEDEDEATGSRSTAITASSPAGSGEGEGEESDENAELRARRGEVICADALATDLGAETEDLLFSSESDYPFESVALEDRAGAGPITPERLLGLLDLDPQTRTEARTIDALFASLIVGSDGARYQTVLDTLKRELTDLAVIRVVPAAPSSAQIRVYVVGRTRCAEVAGLTTIAIET